MNRDVNPNRPIWQIFAFVAFMIYLAFYSLFSRGLFVKSRFMTPLRICILLCVLLTCRARSSFSQSIPAETAKKIDSLFKQWDNKKSPGCAIGIVRNDSLIYAKGYGMANLEYSVPLTTQTVCEMGSVSKQFTAYTIMLLASQGKLSLDDDIHKYLPWMPYYEHKIAIKNLLYHTSGIRDYDQLLSIAGTTQEDVITREHVIKLLSKQESLSFDPGEQYMYSNSGYFLLGEIVHAVTGKSLRQFTDSAIFKPLGMNNTHFRDDYTELVPNRACPYTAADKIGIVNSSAVGAKGLFTNMDDMSKWAINFLNNKSDSHLLIEQMKLSGKLNNGKETGVGAGLQRDDFNGLKMYLHPGIDNGYYNLATYIPEAKMAFIIFSNLGDNLDVFGKRDELAGLFIKDTRPKKEQPGFKTTFDPIVKDTASVQPLLGSYVVDDGDHTAFKLEDRKFYYILNGKYTFILYRTEKDTFWFRGFYPGVKFIFTVKNQHDVTVSQTWPDGRSRIMRKQDPFNALTEKQLLAYTGKYYSSELDYSYSIILKDHQLVLTNNKYHDSPLVIYSATHVINDLDWMRSLDFTKNKQGKITGFEINYDKIQDLRFDKIE
jgi:CubicO group peptidase (beta-lactamase class C family)